MITSAIEAYQGRDMATIDIPGAYIHLDSEKYVIMMLKGRLT